MGDVLQIFKINPSKGRISGPRVVKEKGMKWASLSLGRFIDLSLRPKGLSPTFGVS